MPVYPYQCGICQREFEVIKGMNESSRMELCSICLKPMERIFTSFHFHGEKPFEPHFNHSFGKVVTKKADIENEKARLKHEKGMNLVEVGNDNLKSIQKQKKVYTW